MFRTLLYLGAAAAIIAGPPLLFNKAPGVWDTVASYLPGAERKSDEEKPIAPMNLSAAGGEQQKLISGPQVQSIAEVLRFDVSRSWITSRWPNVTTGGAHLQLDGYRVPLVTGTRQTDIAGSLTYYFNAQQQVERITFTGTTGNTMELVRLLASKYRLVRRPTNAPGIALYEFRHPDGKMSILKITTAAVIKADDPYNRFNVDLRLERPSQA